MSKERSFIENEHFWPTLRTLESLSQETSLEELSQQLGIAQSFILEVVYFLHHLHCSFELKKDGEKTLIVPPPSMPRIQFDFKLSEWLAFQSHFPLLETNTESAAYQILTDKLSQIELKNRDYDFFETAITVINQLPENDSAKLRVTAGVDVEVQEALQCAPYALQLIDYAMVHKVTLDLALRSEKKIKCYPHRLVHLDGALNLIGEELGEMGLIYFAASDIIDVAPDHNIQHAPKLSHLDIDNFINGMRAVSESGVRLILKVRTDLGPTPVPSYHFLGNLVVITNPRNETIWAATVEPCPDLYQWLASLGEKVEILDPGSFKLQFNEYLAQQNSAEEQKFKKSV